MKKERIKQLIRYTHMKALYERYERVLLPATLVVGVLVDWLTFTSINIRTAFLLLGVYVVIAGMVIVYMHAYRAKRIAEHYTLFRYLYLFSPLLIQFTFGALLSATFIFYVFSGSIFVSWPFIAIIVILMISNDVFRQYYLRPSVQVSVYFFILFSLLSILFPFVFNSINVFLFLLSGVISMLMILGYIYLLSRLSAELMHARVSMVLSVVAVAVVLNVCYFLNIMPPIPLSLRDSAVGVALERQGSNYHITVEKQPWFAAVLPGEMLHIQQGESVVVYTAIFAPGTLDTTIVHHWQRYDEQTNTWVSKDKLSYRLSGGRDLGFRGFSLKSSVASGKWRVDIETRRGQVLGRVPFVVNVTTSTPERTIIIR